MAASSDGKVRKGKHLCFFSLDQSNDQMNSSILIIINDSIFQGKGENVESKLTLWVGNLDKRLSE